AGYTAQVVIGKGARIATETTPGVLPSGFPSLDAALSQARQEGKLIVLDFSAEWCLPCKRMERTTFADAKVKELLRQCVLVTVDVDRQEELAQRLGVVGLPDIRFVSADGRVIHKLRGFQTPDSFAETLARLVHTVGR